MWTITFKIYYSYKPSPDPKKKKNIMEHVDPRPISLSNFSNTILSKFLLERMAKVIPKIISPNQTGFANSRNIVKNILLAQEIIRDIRLRSKNHNVVVKLDMTKAYDRVSWIFIMKVLRKFDFYERIIDMVWRMLSHNWYSILVNGQAYDFF